MNRITPDLLSGSIEVAIDEDPEKSDDGGPAQASPNGPQLLAFLHEGSPPDFERVDAAETTWHVAWAPSELALRGRLIEAGERDEPTVILTPLRNGDLPLDVKARLSPGGIRDIRRWRLIARRFGAGDADLRLERSKQLDPLARALEKIRPSAAHVVSDTLDMGTAWSIWARSELGVDDVTSASSWIEATSPGRAGRALSGADEALRPPLVGWLRERRDEEVALAAQLAFLGVNPLAWALAYRCVAPGERAERPAGTGRSERELARLEGALEQLLRDKARWDRDGDADDSAAISTVDRRAAARLAELAEAWAERTARAEDGPPLTSIGDAVDALLGEAGALPLAFRSRVSRRGFDDRAAAVVAEANRIMDEERRDGLDHASTLRRAQTALARLDSHLLAEQHAQIVATHRSLIRLSLASHDASLAVEGAEGDGEEPGRRAVGALARHYILHFSRVDRAREELLAAPVDEKGSSRLRVRLFGWARKVACDADRRFAESLVSVSRAEAAPWALPIERVLDEVIAPLAAARPVLLVVLDAMSWATARALCDDASRLGWHPWVPAHEGVIRPVLSTLPSVTNLARTALLTGELQVGGEAEETRGFEAHGGWKSARLFHKRALQSSCDEVQRVVAADDVRVVGAVINAIDDQLSGAQQLSVRWRVADIDPLPALLESARIAGRTVVIAGDHGHVLDYESTQRSTDDAACGQRWRSGEEPPAAGEVRAEGRDATCWRDGGVVTPWDERIRYTRDKRGYHGGASRPEVVTPVLVLRSDDETPPAEASLELLPWDAGDPWWWRVEGAVRPASDVESAVAERTATWGPVEADDTGQRSLAEVAVESTAAGGGSVEGASSWAWLLASDVYRTQRQIGPNRDVDDDEIVGLLDALDRAGRAGRASVSALAEAMGEGVGARKVRYRVIDAQNVLNVEGFEVLSFDQHDQTVRLDLDLLHQQFGEG